MKTSYTITVRGFFPPNLTQRIAEAHAQALKNLAQPRPQTDGQKPALWDTKTLPVETARLIARGRVSR